VMRRGGDVVVEEVLRDKNGNHLSTIIRHFSFVI